MNIDVVTVKQNIISWPQFEICNPDSQVAFENMCRSLFNRHFFNNKALLHSNPNNPGIEIEPILDSISKKRISFQAKYFSSISYKQIMHSAIQVVKHYSGQLDVLYLYCNKDLTTTSKPYTDIRELLISNNIELVLINNQTIIDQVIDNPNIASLYFKHHGLTSEWFNERLKLSLDSLGPRYNSQFNVETKTEEYIDLFSHNKESINRINRMKIDAVQKIKEFRFKDRSYDDLIRKICIMTNSLSDIESKTMYQCLSWADTIKEAFSKDFTELDLRLKNSGILLENFLDDKDEKKAMNIKREIAELRYLLSFPSLLELNNIEKELILGKVLITEGEAGVGKSQLFANAAEQKFKSNGCSLLLLGNSFLSDLPITNQIPINLELEFGIDELLNILEAMGEQKNQCFVIFIDAINESANKDIWKTGINLLINKIEKLNFVRLALSVRTGYDQLVFDESVREKIQRNDVIKLGHNGFQDKSIEATKVFLNHYNIPFSPYYLLHHEMANPLFLTLFCKTYNGEDFDIFTLFDRIIEKTDKEAQKALGIDGTSNILKYLINEFAETNLCQGKNALTKKELFDLEFWVRFGLNNSKIHYITALERAGLLITSVVGGSEYYYLGYNLLEDFVCAKLIIDKHPQQVSLKRYIKQDLLKIEDGKILNSMNISIFIVVCSLYAEKYNEECIDIIDSVIHEYDKQDLIESYVNSFRWRKASAVNTNHFFEFINKNTIRSENVCRILIENSIKPCHPLNAEILHDILLNKPMHIRDYIWTININNLSHEEERLYQIIDFFDKGQKLSEMTETEIWLFLILFSWLLTSSNRLLRDKASKAIIELLKTNFQFCKKLLETFETVNDPYVIQRLYGVVFGACLKRIHKYSIEFKELSVYIYNTIFNKDFVYPDVLLRDYARLILTRWQYEFSECDEVIDAAKIKPPYLSAEIPVVVQKEYYDKEKRNSGFNSIVRSMQPNIGGFMYGDFGRYVFQSAASNFEEADIENLFHYAMQFIRDELGYDDKLFGDYDTSRRLNYYSRREPQKIERIGKKYQWITLYNILARTSDKHLVAEWGDEPHLFEGPWDPYVRDFDPTLNRNFLHPPNLPVFNLSENFSDEFIDVSSSNKCEVSEWAKKACVFFDSHVNKLIINDSSGKAWVLLNYYKVIKNSQDTFHSSNSIYFENGTQEIWSISNGYFVKQNEFELFKKDLETKNFCGRWFPETHSVYELFNREYGWSPGYQRFFDDSWINYEIDTGEKIVTKHYGCLPRFMNWETPDDIDDLLSFEEREWETVETVKETLGKVMPTHSHILWEEEYDASQEDTTSFDVPCKGILDFLQLEQKEYDGYYYSKEGTLVSFDGKLAKISDGLLIRKDYLDKYLNENDLKLFWTSLGEKQYFYGTEDKIVGEWSGFLYLEGDQVLGEMKNINNNNATMQ